MTAAGQRWDPRQYAANARFVSDLGEPLLATLAPKPGDSVLDLGCGDGVLSRRLRDCGARVIGVDASPEMVAATRALGLEARVADAQALDFEADFDAVFSNAALHWMHDHALVIDGVWRALKPGGRFVGECGGAGNLRVVIAALEAALRRLGLDPALLNPWNFATAEDFAALLRARGFEVIESRLFARPTPTAAGLVAWLETFAKTHTGALPESARAGLREEVALACRDELLGADGVWRLDYVRLRFSAVKPAVT